ncbi:MAG: amidase [Gammaproteobacteria bacterium]|nr:amidase [Gammaproteobacteria bacterium]
MKDDDADPLALDATAQAELLRRGAISAHELAALAIDRIEALNPALNAVIHRRYEAAHAELADVPRDAPFAGVPFLVKDLMLTMAGDPCHAGSRYLQRIDHRAPADSALARRYRRAGFTLLGRTNTPEFGTVCTTEPAACGPTRNPWSLAHSPGGSSGGAAAAVASGMVAVAHGNDGGGSIRVPAAHCGLYGLKPSRGRISHGPTRGEVWMGAAHEHVLTRSVRDSAAVLDLSAGPETGDPYPLSWTPGSAVAATLRDPPRLRIGVMRRCPATQIPLHADCLRAVEAAAALLGSLGHRVEEAHPGALDEIDEEHRFMRVVAAWTAHDLDAAIAASGEPLVAGDLEPHTEIVYAIGRAASATDYLRAQIWLQAWARRIAAWWDDDGFDLLLTPVAALPPPRIGAYAATPADPMAPLRGTVPYIVFTAPFNVTGQPAASLPLHWNDDALPIGVQLVAGAGQDTLLLAVSAELERACPWVLRRPPPPR